MTRKVHAIVKVSPRGRNPGTSRSQTDFNYKLTQPIHFKKRHDPTKQYEVRIENAKVPITFDHFNSTNGFTNFNYTTSITGAITITISDGNYTIDELITTLQAAMNLADTNTYSITYSEISGKITITETAGGENITAFTGTGWINLGITSTQTLSASSSLTAIKKPNTTPISWVKIVLDNITASNFYENDQNANTQLQRTHVDIPLTKTRGNYEFYDNHEGPVYKLPAINSIIDFNVRLLDAKNNVVDLFDVDWSFNVVIYEWNKYPEINPTII